MRILIELWLRPLCQGIIGTTAALLGIGLASAAGSAASGILGSKAASKAATDQSQTALQVAQLQSQDANKALDFQKSQYSDAVARMQPWLRTGSGATNVLDRLLGMSPSFLSSATPATPSQTTPATLPGQGGLVGSHTPIRNGSNFFNPGSLTAQPDPNELGAGGFNRFGPTGVSSGSPGGGVGEIQFGPDGEPTDVTPNFSPEAQTLNINPTNVTTSQGGPGQVPITNATTNPGGTGQVPQTGGNTVTADGSPGTVPRADGGSSGTVGTASNGDTTGLPDGFLSQIWNQQFQAPTALDETNDPGYQARLKLGSDTLERSAAARGNLLTGGEAKNLDQFAQDYASNEYGNVYNRAANTFSTNYNIFKQNQNDIFNRYATLAGYGQTAAGQLNNQGVATGGQVGSTLLTSGAQIGGDLNAAAAARGSGYVGSTNAITGAIGSGINSTMDLLAMYQAMQKGASVGAV